MPRRLLDRCQPDCIREFRVAARQRFDDALVLAGNGRRTGAIYLWGYTAEMTLKAAYFALIGLADADVITWNAHLQQFKGDGEWASLGRLKGRGTMFSLGPSCWWA